MQIYLNKFTILGIKHIKKHHFLTKMVLFSEGIAKHR